MLDPVMSIILKAGSLSLQELLARAGAALGTRVQLARLIKSGEVSIEATKEGDRTTLPRELTLEPNLGEDEIVARLDSIAQGQIAETIEISPTAKAWRSSSAA